MNATPTTSSRTAGRSAARRARSTATSTARCSPTRCLDVDQAEIGNEVTVQWGDHGGRIKDVRATVERFPYLTDPRNSDVDTATLS